MNVPQVTIPSQRRGKEKQRATAQPPRVTAPAHLRDTGINNTVKGAAQNGRPPIVTPTVLPPLQRKTGAEDTDRTFKEQRAVQSPTVDTEAMKLAQRRNRAAQLQTEARKKEGTIPTGNVGVWKPPATIPRSAAAAGTLSSAPSTSAPYAAGLQARQEQGKSKVKSQEQIERERAAASGHMGPFYEDFQRKSAERTSRTTKQALPSFSDAVKLRAASMEMAKTKRLAQLDIGAAEKRVAELKAAAVEAKAAHTAVDADPKYTYWDGIYESAEAANEAYLADSNAAWETRKKIDDELAALNQDIESAKLVQYYMTPTRDDFEVYAARGGAMKNNVVKTVREMNPQMRSALEQRRIPFPDQPGLTYDHLAYARLTDQEARIYNYLLAKDNERGTNYASEYLSFMMDPMKAREGREMADAVKNSGIFRPVLTAGQGIISGTESFVNSVQQAFSREQLPTSANQFASAYIFDDLKDVGPKFSGRSLGQIGYGAAELAGSLAPRVALGAIHPVLGIASGSVSTYGNTYGQALAQGYSEGQARSYATIRAAIDGTLQYVAGGFPQLGGGVTEKVASRVVEHIDHAALRVAADVGIHGLAQGSRDYLMTTLDPALRNWILDEDNDVSLISEDGAYAFFTGFLTAGTMRLPGAIRTERNRPGTALAVRKFGTDMPNYLAEDGTDYFDGVEDEAGAKARYHDLARKNHPDMGGSEAAMQEINRQYEMRVNYYKGQASGAQAAAAWKNPARSGAQGPIAQPNAGDSASGMGLMLPGGSLPAQSSMGVPGPIPLGPGVTTAPNGPVLDPKTSPAAMLPEAGMATIEDTEAPSTAIDTNPATHTPEQMALIKAYQGAVDKSILTFIDRWRGLKDPNYRKKVRMDIASVDQRTVTDIKAAIGVDVSDFTGHSLSGNALEHIDLRHGAKGEADQSMADPNDIARMGYVLKHYDSVEPLIDKHGRPVVSGDQYNADGSRAPLVRFLKRVDGTYYVVEAVPDSAAREFRVISAYIEKTSRNTDRLLNVPQSDPQPTSKTPDGAYASALGNSIPQPPGGVNLQRSLPGDIPADIPPGLRKLYRLAQEMSASPPPREIPQRPVQQSPQEILSQLAWGMAMGPQAREIPQRPVQQSPQEILTQLAREITQGPGGPLADRSDADIIAMMDKISPTGEGLQSDTDDDIITSGAISGALNPTGKRARKHAKRYYGLIRKMKTDVARIAKNTGYEVDQIRQIKQYLFFDSHILAGGKFERFTPDFDMAQSWKRLLEGIDIKQHDLTLLKHEIMEMELVESGMSQDEAHRQTSAIYNYAKEAEEYNDTIKKYKD